ncbi:Agamous-like MADS-box protein AGL62 [Morus notabilis]|uniref:Agamous-like MADS-box protein AGL62 n=2 Tax=Morus notabilis TaxID=981085 RepID=W9R7M8_9ROSA|nr:Agamous-like MADS-box protein AGL62 [Morus notabilis]
MAKKPIISQGRKKIVMAKIPNQSNLQVTFSKRRSGIFKKASELCTLCGVEIAIIAFSPANKPFSFGHPSVDSVVDRFLIGQKNSSMKCSISGNNQMIVHELNVELTQLLSELEAEKRKGQELEGVKSQCWWESPVDELSLSGLESLKAAMEELKNKVNMTRQEHMIASVQQISAARFHEFLMMNGGYDHDVFNNKPVDDFTNLREAHNFGFGNEIF